MDVLGIGIRAELHVSLLEHVLPAVDVLDPIVEVRLPASFHGGCEELGYDSRTNTWKIGSFTLIAVNVHNSVSVLNASKVTS